MELFNHLSSELVEILAGLSLPVKVGWPVFVLWAIGQTVWFRWAREASASVTRAVAAPAPSPRRTRPASGIKPPVTPSRAAGSPEFIAALAGEDDERAAALRLGDVATMADAPSARTVYR
jgi:hypothetical protein